MPQSKKIIVKLKDATYKIIIGHKILSSIGTRLKEIGLNGKILVVTQAGIKKHYGALIVKSLTKKGFWVDVFVIPNGEQSKNLKTVSKLYDFLLSKKFNRSSTVIALGGGVVGDITGFVASTFMRGIAFIQVPTTLLAQVDAAIGGKTGVNHILGKNLIGAFYQPKLVLSDVATLTTLPRREIKSGLAEVVKSALIQDKKLYTYLLKLFSNSKVNLSIEQWLKIVYACSQIKSHVVTQDEKEKGVRAILNFGHTVGHAIESATKYQRYTHGEAVALGMVSAAHYSRKCGTITEREYQSIIDLLTNMNFRTVIRPRLSEAAILRFIRFDKKSSNGKLNFIILKKIGVAIIKTLSSPSVLKSSIQKITKVS